VLKASEGVGAGGFLVGDAAALRLGVQAPGEGHAHRDALNLAEYTFRVCPMLRCEGLAPRRMYGTISHLLGSASAVRGRKPQKGLGCNNKDLTKRYARKKVPPFFVVVVARSTEAPAKHKKRALCALSQRSVPFTTLWGARSQV
jgi:hypothetical protein